MSAAQLPSRYSTPQRPGNQPYATRMCMAEQARETRHPPSTTQPPSIPQLVLNYIR